MLLRQVATINSLPLTTVKFHQLQVFRDTPMAAEYDADPGRFRFWEIDEYLDLFVEILRRLRPDLVVEGSAALPLRPQLGPRAQRTAAGDARKKIGRAQRIPRGNFFNFAEITVKTPVTL